MKKLLFYFLLFMLFGSTACKPNFDAVNPTTPCDNTTSPFTIQLDFTGTFYNCNKGPYLSVPPPLATNINYTNTKSSTDAITSTDKNAYLCEMNVKNDQPAENPQNPCSNAGISKFFWTVPGYTQNISGFARHQFDITVDYYEPEDQWCNQGRPYFFGKLGLPAGASASSCQMFTGSNYHP